MYEFLIENKLRKIMKTIFKKDRTLHDALIKKIHEVVFCKNVNHYKNLRAPLNFLKRIHIKGPFVLIFSYDASKNIIKFHNLDHHDKIYQ